MIIDMFLHFGLGGESSPAVRHRTAERSVALMGARVLIQDGFLSEIFTALTALVRFLSGVDAEMLIEDGPLPEKPRTVDASVRFLVGVNPQVLRQVRLLPESLPAFRTRIRSRFNMYATVLEERGFLFELFLTNGTSHVQRHSRRTSVLDHIGKTRFATRRTLQVLEGAEVRSAEHGVIETFGILKISRVLHGVRRWEAVVSVLVRMRAGVCVSERGCDFFLSLIGRKGHVLGPKGRCHPVLEYQMRRNIWN
jgi:hypothetical protein